MLTVKLESREFFNSDTSRFITVPSRSIDMEHSLVSISKWEQKLHKPFLSTEKNSSDLLYYLRCMCLKSEDTDYVSFLSKENIDQIRNYIDDPMTATTFRFFNGTGAMGKKEIFTAEVIYYYMFSFGIPKECETWHINTLMTLLQVFGVKNSNNKPSKKDIMARNRAINKANKARYGIKN